MKDAILWHGKALDDFHAAVELGDADLIRETRRELTLAERFLSQVCWARTR